MSDQLDPIVERIPVVCTFDETCRLLKLSRSTGKRLKAAGAFPVRELQPRFDDRPRFSGEDVLAAIRERSEYGRRQWSRRRA